MASGRLNAMHTNVSKKQVPPLALGKGPTMSIPQHSYGSVMTGRVCMRVCLLPCLLTVWHILQLLQYLSMSLVTPGQVNLGCTICLTFFIDKCPVWSCANLRTSDLLDLGRPIYLPWSSLLHTPYGTVKRQANSIPWLLSPPDSYTSSVNYLPLSLSSTFLHYSIHKLVVGQCFLSCDHKHLHLPLPGARCLCHSDIPGLSETHPVVLPELYPRSPLHHLALPFIILLFFLI